MDYEICIMGFTDYQLDDFKTGGYLAKFNDSCIHSYDSVHYVGLYRLTII